jgi:hypothetical protein
MCKKASPAKTSPSTFFLFPLSPTTTWEEEGRDEELGLLSMHGSFYFAYSVPNDVKTQLKSNGRGGRGEVEYRTHIQNLS